MPAGAAAGPRPRPSGSTRRAALKSSRLPLRRRFRPREGERPQQRQPRSRSESYPSGASWVGALDMSGNAMEWVSDWLATDYCASSPATDPTGPATGEKKVEKGGWWGSNEFRGSGPPTATTRTRRPTATSTSASGWPPSEPDRGGDGRRRVLDGAGQPAPRRSRARRSPVRPAGTTRPRVCFLATASGDRRSTSPTSTRPSPGRPRPPTCRCSCEPRSTSTRSCSNRTSSTSAAATPRT